MITPNTRDGEAERRPAESAAGRSGGGVRDADASTIPTVHVREVRQGQKPGERYVRIHRPFHETFREAGPDTLVAREQVDVPRSTAGRLWRGVRRVLIGAPLATADLIHERISKAKALAIFSSDALSSSAYASEEILRILVIGVILTLLTEKLVVDPAWRLLLVVGSLGGYTTFSSYTFEALALLAEGEWLPTLGYVVGSNGLGLVAAFLRLIAARAVWR